MDYFFAGREYPRVVGVLKETYVLFDIQKFWDMFPVTPTVLGKSKPRRNKVIY